MVCKNRDNFWLSNKEYQEQVNPSTCPPKQAHGFIPRQLLALQQIVPGTGKPSHVPSEASTWSARTETTSGSPTKSTRNRLTLPRALRSKRKVCKNRDNFWLSNKEYQEQVNPSTCPPKQAHGLQEPRQLLALQQRVPGTG
ncbi:hypothetical protein O0L34_g18883 [Tuta absoluta]|nr:hypothetical protein O0L34_g18883 [Tuta absoluta]